MRQASRRDKSLVVDIISITFRDNPGVNWMFSDKGDKTKKIKRLAEFAFIKCLNRNGVFISSNEKGVALCFRSDLHRFSWLELYYEIRFGLLSIPLSKLREVIRREAYRKSKRPKDEPHYYFWFLGVLREGARAGFELNKGLMKIASEENVPIYLETTVERNKRIYERIGYQAYDYWEDETRNIRFWFLRWQNN